MRHNRIIIIIIIIIIPQREGESETSFQYRKISILVLRFNAVLLRDSFPAIDCIDR